MCGTGLCNNKGMKVKDLLEQLKNADPEKEINLGDEVGPTPEKKGHPSIYFYERPDGVIIQLTDKEAYTVQYEYTPPWKQVGASDGSTWRAMTKEIREKMTAVKSEVQQYESQQVPVPAKLRLKFATTHIEFQKINNDAIKAELEKARGNIVRPPNNHIIGTPAGREAMGASKRIHTE